MNEEQEFLEELQEFLEELFGSQEGFDEFNPESELEKAIKKFKDSAIKINENWDRSLNETYPFQENFEELILKIIEWKVSKMNNDINLENLNIYRKFNCNFGEHKQGEIIKVDDEENINCQTLVNNFGYSDFNEYEASFHYYYMGSDGELHPFRFKQEPTAIDSELIEVKVMSERGIIIETGFYRNH